MARARTIASSNEIGDALRQGQRRSSGVVTVHICATPEQRGPEGRVAYIAAKRLGGAVWRNRSRRVLREAFRQAGGPVPGFDILLVASRTTAETPPAEVAASIVEMLRRLGARRVQ
jgi:ribonuclease P protein component